MAVDANVAFFANINETLSNVDGAAQQTINLSAFDETFTMNADSTPPGTKCVVKLIALTAGAYTIDLTTITGTNGVVQDMTGLRVQLIRVKNLGANNMTFTPGASNGIDIGCGAFTVPAGWTEMKRTGDTSVDVASGDRTIDVTGTAAQTFELTIIAG